MNWYLKVLRNYAVFSGRARRKEYWMFGLYNLIFSIAAIIMDNILGTAIEDVGYGLFYFLYALAVIVPSLAVGVRRLHDVGKSGWFLLVALIPIVGAIWLLVLFCTDGNAGENEYGPNPKETADMDMSSEFSLSLKTLISPISKENRTKDIELSGTSKKSNFFQKNQNLIVGSLIKGLGIIYLSLYVSYYVASGIRITWGRSRRDESEFFEKIADLLFNVIFYFLKNPYAFTLLLLGILLLIYGQRKINDDILSQYLSQREEIQ